MDLSSHRISRIGLDDDELSETARMLSHRLSLNPLQEMEDEPARASESGPVSASSMATELSISSPAKPSKERDLKLWLNDCHLEGYSGVLLENDITLDCLPYLGKEEIKSLIDRVGDRIRLSKAIVKLSQRTEGQEGLSYQSSSPYPQSGGERPSVPVRFHNVDGKTIHLDFAESELTLAMVLQSAKLPLDGSYRINNAFDFFDSDSELRRAIFDLKEREFWISARDAESLVESNVTAKKDDGYRERSASISYLDRPTSGEVASRLPDFFPAAKQELLEEGLRNSLLINRRFSMVSDGWRSSILSSRRFSRLPSMVGAQDSKRTSFSTGSTETLAPSERDTLTDRGIDEEFLEKLDHEEMSPTEWLRGKLIGNGSFGSVYLAFNVFSGDIMAVKQVQLMRNDQRHKKMVDAMHQEISILRDLEHPNIVQYRGFKNEGQFLNIFLEYVPGGSLATRLATSGPLKEYVVRGYIKQCLSGLAYLHEKGIVHRDIKGANILVDTHDHVKISDFGLSKQEDAAKQRYSMQGTAFWMAPEVARAREQTTTKADIWSLGCLIIELVTGQHPFPRLQAFQAIYKIGKGSLPDLPEHVSPSLENLLLQCLQVEPRERPTAAELLAHPFLSEDVS